MTTFYRKLCVLSVRDTKSLRHVSLRGPPNVIHLCKADDPFYDPYWYTPKYVYSTHKKALKAAIKQLESDLVDKRREVARDKVVLHDMECILENYKRDLKAEK